MSDDLKTVLLQEKVAELEQQLAERKKQIVLYEKALAASWPEGAIGDAFDFWNAARKLSDTEPPKDQFSLNPQKRGW